MNDLVAMKFNALVALASSDHYDTVLGPIGCQSVITLSVLCSLKLLKGLKVSTSCMHFESHF